jgi:hypothetical protein
MEYKHKKLLEEIDTYTDTVWATLVFAHECSWNPTAKKLDATVKFGVGRSMTRPDKKVVTPDLVIQRRPEQGIVAEIKHVFPPASELGRRKEIFQQLKNYDVPLKVWWIETKEIDHHDLVLLTHTSHAVEAVDFLTKDLASEEEGKFERNLAIISYSRSDQNEPFILLRKEHGSMLDPKLGEKLRLTVPVAVRHIVLKGDVRFCDSSPPVPYILRLMWEQVFPPQAEEIERDKKRGYTPIPVTVDKLTKTLQVYFGYKPDGTGNKGLPQKEWVENALNTLCSLKMAHQEDDKSYVIRYKTIHGDVLERFGRICFELQQKKEKNKKPKSVQQAFDFSQVEPGLAN